MLDSISLVFYSPTGGCLNIARHIASFISKSTIEIDLSTTEGLDKKFDKTNTVLVSVPVYGGRLPALVLERLKKIKGNGAKTISIVCYGNRDYEDALLELNDELKGLGYEIFASSACITPHSLCADFGAGRPDEADLKILNSFGQDVLKKLSTGKKTELNLKGKKPYKEYKQAPITPLTRESCILCGECVKSCPSKAIILSDKLITDASLCNLCARCIKICPTESRIFPEAFTEQVKKMLSQHAVNRKEIEIFI